MDSIRTKLKSMDFLVAILFLQPIVYATIFFDIPVARQAVGFIYFSFVPGFVTVKLLKFDKLDALETLLFSVGLSIAFLMILGLFLNEFGFLVGISQPLSLTPLIITLNGITLIGVAIVYLRGDRVKLWSNESLRMSPLMLLLMAIPFLSIVGAMLMTVYSASSVILFTIIAISILFVVGVISEKLLPSKFYPLAVLVIAIAILYHATFISNYLVHFGSDLTGEYFAFKTTQNSMHWSSTNPYLGGAWEGFGRLDAMLSVTLLPTIYSTLLNLDPMWIFKMLFPLIFSLVPLGLYEIWQTRLGRKFAFVAVFLFVGEATFYTEMLGLNRQMVAELFFVLSLLVIVNRHMKSVNKMICFMIFSTAMVMSHYAIAEIFLFFIAFVLVYLVVLRRPKRNITATMVVFFLVVMFFWYIYTSNSAVFNSFLDFGNYVSSQLGDFFNPASRGTEVMRGLGMEASSSVWNTISRSYAYLTEALILIGFIGLITRRLKIQLDAEYFALTSLSMVLLAAVILVPGLANTLNMTRFYHILLFFLAPLCVLGIKTIVDLISKRSTQVMVSILVLVVLVPYFLFQTGFVYEVTKSDSWSVPLSKYRMNDFRLYGQLGYTDAYNVFGPQWLSNNVDVEHTEIYADYYARSELRGYGLVYMGYIQILSNITELPPNGIVYLTPLGVNEETLVGERYSWNLSEIQYLNDLNQIYSNGGSNIYKNQP